MRLMVVISGALFMLGIILQAIANVFGPVVFSTPNYLPYAAFFCILVGPALLMFTVILSLLPGESRKMNSCRH
jgi:hypothetical protein